MASPQVLLCAQSSFFQGALERHFKVVYDSGRLIMEPKTNLSVKEAIQCVVDLSEYNEQHRAYVSRFVACGKDR